MTNPLVVKLGGGLLDSETALKNVFTALAHYRQSHQRPLLIVHGGGSLVDTLMKQLNLPVVKKNGLRVTPSDHMGIITGALAGTANKTLLAWAIKYRLPSIGLSLADGMSLSVTQLAPEFGHVGHASPHSPHLLNILLDAGYLPIINSIGITEEGNLMNVNADQAATTIATMLNTDLILLSDVAGILDDTGKCLAEITAQQAEMLIEQAIITDGMVVKVNAALEAARQLKRPVSIASWHSTDGLIDLFNGISMGTRIIA